jgi:hypothetical protein
MYNIITSPPQYEPGLSCRYFVDLSEYAGENIDLSKFITKVYYSPADATISGLKPFDKEKNIYYVEISFPKPVYARTYVQFCIYYYENKLWDPSNDFSYKGIELDEYNTLENIPIYKDGVQVSGKDPAGNGPGIVSPTATAIVTPTQTAEKFVYGDVNGDDLANAIDFALMRKHLLGMIEEFPYEYGLQAADLDCNGSFNAIDFATMRKYLIGIITELPLKK